MFDNIGSKIKVVAKVECWIGIFLSVIIGFVLLVQDEDAILTGFLVMVLGSLSSWVGSFMTYGFGQLIENSDTLVEQGRKSRVPANSIPFQSNTSYTQPNKHQWRCNGCGNMISDEICPICNKDKIDNLKKWKEKGLITEEEFNNKMESLNNG